LVLPYRSDRLSSPYPIHNFQKFSGQPPIPKKVRLLLLFCVVGNDNDADPTRYEPHYREITNPQQVEIFEPVLRDEHGHVTTGLLSAVGYLKDNRLLPDGFDKQTAGRDIKVVGNAASDPNFTGEGSRTRYVVNVGRTAGPFQAEAELWYQPIRFRWAHNLAPYKAAEPQRFVSYYESASGQSAVIVSKAEVSY